jgi:hypothetical protein
MRVWLASLALLMSIPHASLAQEHLEPDANAFVDPDGYLLKARQIFEQAFDEEVALRALVLHSRLIKGEFVFGVHVKDGRAEAFVLEPSSNIWMSENLENCRKAITSYKEDGERVPAELLDRLKDLEKEAVDYRKIKATRRAQPIPQELAQQIKDIWEKMLVDVKHPEKPINGNDGVTYHYSAWVKERGEISGHVWSPKSGSKTGRLTALAEAIGDYARGKVDLDRLKKRVEEARASIKP